MFFRFLQVHDRYGQRARQLPVEGRFRDSRRYQIVSCHPVKKSEDWRLLIQVA